MRRRIGVVVGVFAYLATSALAGGAGDPFPKDYSESRATFRALTAAPDSKRGSFVVPSKVDPDLTVDWAHFPALARKDALVVLISGVHGPEAFAGAAIQREFLTRTLPALDRAKIGVLLIHAMNPYGFKYGRRVTENNVDLNRNFDEDPALFTKKNDGYVALRSLLQPEGKVGWPFWSLLNISSRVGWAMLSGKFTRGQINQAVSQGQYEFANGFEYGGSSFEPQSVFLAKLLREQAASYSRIVFLDLHTGLGDHAVLHILTGGRVAQNDSAMIDALLRKNLNRTAFELTADHEPGFYRTHGDSIDLPPIVLPKARVVAATMEFGTVGSGIFPQLAQLNKMVLESQGAQHGYANESVERQVKQDFVEVFYPASDAEWKSEVLRKARLFLDGVIAGL